MGEHLPCKQGVKGSNPFISSVRTVGRYLFLENRIPNNIKIFCDEEISETISIHKKIETSEGVHESEH